jgi:hypothetical protein
MSLSFFRWRFSMVLILGGTARREERGTAKATAAKIREILVRKRMGSEVNIISLNRKKLVFLQTKGF